MTAKTVIYRRLGEHRGKKRLWLDGQRLARAGVEPGQMYWIETGKNSVTLRFSADGDRKVSRKKAGDRYLPVIDLTADALAEAIGEVERVRVVIRDGEIVVTVHHLESTKADRVRRLIEKVSAGRPLAAGSIAHGGGVLDHALHQGLEDAGIPVRLAWANELEGRYLESSVANNPIFRPDTLAIEGPMQEVQWGKLPKVDLLAAGLPCTGASLSGRAKNSLGFAEAHETAGSLFLAFLTAIQTLKPAIVVLENVPPYRNTISAHVIRSVLAEMEYEVHEMDLDGHAMGAVENRQRYCMVAISQGVDGVDFDQVAPVRQPEPALADLLEDLGPDSTRWKDYAYLAEKETRDKAAGKGFRRQLLDGSEPTCGTIGRGYNKARSTEPFIRHPDGNGKSRLLTPREHARVKTIPEELVDGLSDTIAHEILGQSVIHCAFEAVGRCIGEGLSHYRQVKIAA